MALILSSKSPKIFSAGLDFKLLMTGTHEERSEYLAYFIGTVRRLITFPCPTICVTQGRVIAGGVFLNLGFDYRIGVEEGATYYHLNEIENGMPLTPELSSLVTGRVEGGHLKTQMAAFGMKVSPKMGLEGGLLHHIAADRQVNEKKRGKIMMVY
jgi:enoyl-CoA hydratase/carnithine racemase